MAGTTAYVAALNKALGHGDATEHTHRPALQEWIQSFRDGVTATNEPKKSAIGMPDYDVKAHRRHGTLSVGKIEAKDVGSPLDKLLDDSRRDRPRTRDGEQLKRYLAAYPNVILTDYVKFIWLVKGEETLRASLGAVVDGHVDVTATGPADAERLVEAFLSQQPQRIRSAKALAEKMAGTAAIIHDVVTQGLNTGTLTSATTGLKDSFKETLVADLTDAQFADMLAQTLAYGLFAARVQFDGSKAFTRQVAATAIPRTNPFLRGLFAYLTGPELDDEPHAGLVDDLAQLLADTDIAAVLKNFGAERRDPIVHFYETFLAAYDPSLRDIRGVYYTPLPVVAYIVASVDHALKDAFGLQDGVADTAKTSDGEHKVLILDPATGTSTFLYEVIATVRRTFVDKKKTGLWAPYVREHLLPRLFGFEIMMAPYAVAHLKLALQLAGKDLPENEREDIAYDFATDERVAVYLTNALEPGETHSSLPLGKFISDEANAASAVKTDKPIMVVVGNPPYQGQSANASTRREYVPAKTKTGKGRYRTVKTAIGGLLDTYYQVDGASLGERNPKWLQDDYVKFIRSGQSRIDTTGHGVLAYVTNHTYLDAPTFRGMRQSLLTSFDHIYVLDLHGSTRRREVNPNGGVDENVFDQIQQGVAIAVFVKTSDSPAPATVHYADLWGSRTDKYAWLDAHRISDTQWSEFVPTTPFYSFRPEDPATRAEWDAAPSLTEVFPVHSTGVVTHRDEFAIDTRAERLRARLDDFCDPKLSHEKARAKYFGTSSRTTASGIVYKAGDNRDWNMAERRDALMKEPRREAAIKPITHRPFDNRHIFYHRDAVDSMKADVMRHMIAGPNLGLISARSNKSPTQDQFFVTNLMSEVKAGEATTGSVLFPLWLYPVSHEGTLPLGDDREANLGPIVATMLKDRINLDLISEPHGDLTNTVGPKDVLDYIYAVVHSRSYRLRYLPFLRSDYPHVPFTSDRESFRALCQLGRRLVDLHTLTADDLEDGPATAPSKGSGLVEKIPLSKRWIPADDPETPGVIVLNPDSGKDGAQQVLEGVSQDVWEMHVGGHRVLHKWLDARAGDQLTYDETVHLVRTVNALSATLEVQDAIEELLTEWPLT